MDRFYPTPPLKVSPRAFWPVLLELYVRTVCGTSTPGTRARFKAIAQLGLTPDQMADRAAEDGRPLSDSQREARARRDQIELREMIRAAREADLTEQ